MNTLAVTLTATQLVAWLAIDAIVSFTAGCLLCAWWDVRDESRELDHEGDEDET